MEQTQLISLQTPTHLVCRLKNGSSFMPSNPKKIIDNLLDIFEKYSKWDDLVSLKIKEWGEKIFTIDSKFDFNDPNSLLKKIESDINELFIKVLRSALLNPLIEEPLLDENKKYTWEKKEIQLYCYLYITV